MEENPQLDNVLFFIVNKLCHESVRAVRKHSWGR